MAKIIHGLYYHPLYRVWRSMINRCSNSICHDYKNYGGRGISVCDEWRTDFKTFYDWAISNGWESGLQLDRINVNGNYEPLNTRIVTDAENRNNKRNSAYLVLHGEKKTMSQWAKETGIKVSTIRERIVSRQWSHEKTLTTPVKKRK